MYSTVTKRCLSLRIYGWLGKLKWNIGCLKKKKDFYSHLNIEEVTDADDAHTKGVCNDFEIKN